MQQHKQLERAFRLGRIPPFDRLPLEARFIVAGATVKRSYGPHALIVPKGETPEEVLIPLEGSILHGDHAVAEAFDVPGVLMSRTALVPFLAGAEGCTVLALTKSHMHTLVRECPRVIERYLLAEEQRS